LQARRQDVAAGGGKNEKEGPKIRREGDIFKIQYCMYAATGGPNMKWGAGHQWPPAGDGPGRVKLFYANNAAFIDTTCRTSSINFIR